MSSAPASSACSSSRSSSGEAAFSTTITPFRVNIQAVEPVSPRLPLFRVKACRTSCAVRFRLSVSASTNRAMPPGA
jgi:hypothetical protein